MFGIRMCGQTLLFIVIANCAIVHREMRHRERVIDDVTDDVMRDVTGSVVARETEKIAVDFHATYVTQRLNVLRQCSDAVQLTCLRVYLNVWKTRLSGT